MYGAIISASGVWGHKLDDGVLEGVGGGGVHADGAEMLDADIRLGPRHI